MTRYVCVDDQKAAGFPVTAACEAAEVSTSGYYDRCAREAAGPTERQLVEEQLVQLMRDIFDAADGNYGVPRMFKALRKAGLKVNKKRVHRLMRKHGMAGRHRRRVQRTTFPGPDGYVIPDLVGRRFDPAAPDLAWVQDITYIANHPSDRRGDAHEAGSTITGPSTAPSCTPSQCASTSISFDGRCRSSSDCEANQPRHGPGLMLSDSTSHDSSPTGTCFHAPPADLWGRVRRESHVRSCESRGVRFPAATHQNRGCTFVSIPMTCF